MKRRIILTESQLQNVLTRVVKRVVNEARRRRRMMEGKAAKRTSSRKD